MPVYQILVIIFSLNSVTTLSVIAISQMTLMTILSHHQATDDDPSIPEHSRKSVWYMEKDSGI